MGHLPVDVSHSYPFSVRNSISHLNEVDQIYICSPLIEAPVACPRQSGQTMAYSRALRIQDRLLDAICHFLRPKRPGEKKENAKTPQILISGILGKFGSLSHGLLGLACSQFVVSSASQKASTQQHQPTRRATKRRPLTLQLSTATAM